jgi:general secretion pathway protein D
MRGWPAGILFLLVTFTWAEDTPSPPATPACSTPAASTSCDTEADSVRKLAKAEPSLPAAPVPLVPSVSDKDRKAARHSFRRGVKFDKSQRLEDAFDAFEEAAHLDPVNPKYVAAREMTREYLAGVHIDRGNSALLQGRQGDALTEFRAALNLDPANEFAQERVQDAAGAPQVHLSAAPQLVGQSNHLTTEPASGLDGLHDIHYRGDSRGLLNQVAASYGLTVVFDDSFPSHRVRVDLDQVDFATAIREASAVTKSFVVPLEPTVLFAVAENAENHKQFDRMGFRTFYVPGVNTTQDLNEILNAVRAAFEFKFVAINTAASTITIRGNIAALEAATRFMSQLNGSPPEVMLEVNVMEVSHSYATNIGLHVPDQFTLINIPAAALALTSGQSIQSLINQVISSGGINQAGNSTISALIAQLEGQGGGNSIFSNPLATFGGGLSLFGVTLDQLAAVLNLNESSVSSLQHVTLRASQGKEATLKVGERYPVLNASFAPIANNTAISGVLQNQSYTAPFPSVNYEDLGLMLKAKPTIHHDSSVGLEVTVQFRALGTGTVNSVPIINQREYTGGIVLKDGEPAAIAGLLTESDQRSIDGLPTFAQIPGFGVLVSQHSNQEMDDELLIVMTPHLVSDPSVEDPPPIWLPR